MLRQLTLSLALLSTTVLFAQSSSERAAVRITATVQTSTSITLSWAPISSTTGLTIYRKTKSGSSWGSAVATPGATATTWTDNSVSTGVNYEYKIVRVSAGVTGTGYISTGVQLPVVDYRGKMILLVDNSLSSALSTEINQLIEDLRADGWGVIRSDVSRTASVASVKSIVQGHYSSDPANVKALYILGHVPVPYSGNITPDGHDDTRGARPTDAYYADMDGTWTDNSVNTSITSQQRTWNTPGDGKFDQSDLPSPVELQVGRVDMYDLPAFGTTEVQLMRNYLNKAHNYKVKGWTPNPRAVLVDNLQWVGNPIAASGWRASQLVGQVRPEPQAPILSFRNYVNGQSYLWTAHYGGGSIAMDGNVTTYNGIEGGLTTQELASSVTMGGVFNMALGSYFYDFDSRNNFLRAVIAKGDGLTNCWAGIPSWYFHHMGMGDNIGYSVAASMNNTGLYAPLTEGWQSSIGRTHMNLMGDPSLRMKMLTPPSNLAVSNAGGTAAFSWTASPEGAMGYHIYQVDANAGSITRLTSSLVTGTSWNNGTVPFVAGRQYMVRAVVLEVAASGSYYNMSLGAMAVAAGGAAADCLGTVGGSATMGSSCNDNNACTINDVYNANCQCVGTSITPAATITASGSTTFCTGGSVVLNANTGAGYSYAWRRNNTVISGATSSSYTATQAGTYMVTVTYNGCSSSSASTTVTIASAPTASISAAGNTTFCDGGSVVLNAGTGTGYTYAWHRNGSAISGATSSSYTAAQTGSYTAVVSVGSCTATSNAVTVTVSGTGATPTITASGSTTFCTGGNVVLSTGTASGNSYQWRRNGSNISGATSSSYTATQAGSYTVAVTNGACSGTSSAVTVTVSGTGATPTITTSGPTSFCSGGNVILATQQASGNTYQWRWNGSPISGATSYAYTAFYAGEMTVTVTNGSCTATSAPVTIAVGTVPSATISAGGTTSFCSGGSVILSGNTGTGYTYGWSRNGTTISGATGSTYTATQAGSYTRTVTNSGCSATSTSINVTVSGTGATPTITASGSTTFCTGGSVVLSTATASGNSYAWRRNGSNISGATGSSYTVTQAGSYTVAVTNGACSGTSSAVTVTVSTSTTPTITASGSTTFCTGGSVVLSTATASGNSYVWRRNGSNISGATGSSYTATQAGSYTVAVTNGACSGTSSAVTVTVSTSTTPTITASGSTTFCTGGSVVLSTATASGNSYVWRRNGSNISGATGSSYTATQAGSYTVAVTNGACSGTSSATTVSTSGSGMTPTITAYGPTSFCSGGNVILVTQQISGASYQWYFNGWALPSANSYAYTAFYNGQFTVTVTTGSCSGTSAPITLAVGTMPSATITANGPTSFCSGGSVVLSGNTGNGFTYSWSRNGSAISGATGSTYTATEAGTYRRTVTNNGCSATSSAINVTTGAGSTPTITAQGSTSFCSGGSVALTTAAASGNSYQWRRNGTTISGATGSSYTATQSGSYTVAVSNGSCSGTSNAITVNASGSGMTPTITAYGPTSFCSGGNVILVTQQISGASYQWRYNGVTISGATSYAYTAYLNGQFTVTVSTGGCSGTSAPMPISVGSAPSASITPVGSTSFCTGGNVRLNANTGNGLTYAWFRNGTAISGATGSSHIATLTGSYTVQVTNNGCSRTSSAVMVTANGAPTASCTANPASGTVSVSVSGGMAPYTYAWNTTPVRTTASVTVPTSGTYSVTVTDARGCTSTCTTTITLPTSNACTSIRTETQNTWGAPAWSNSTAAYMASNFASAFPAPDYLTIGCGSRRLRLTSGSAVIAFLPSNGPVDRVPGGLAVNPTNYGNTFAGQLVALKLSVRLDEVNAAFSPATTLLKDMVVAQGTFAGWTVAQVIAAADQKIGSCGHSQTREALNDALTAINEGYAGGTMDSGYLTCPGGSGMMPAPEVGTDGAVAETGNMDAAALTVTAFPNPASDATTLFFTPARSTERAILEIRSVSGALVEARELGVLPAGVPQRVVWNVAEARSGVYLYRIATGSEVASGRIVVE